MQMPLNLQLPSVTLNIVIFKLLYLFSFGTRSSRYNATILHHTSARFWAGVPAIRKWTRRNSALPNNTCAYTASIDTIHTETQKTIPYILILQKTNPIY